MARNTLRFGSGVGLGVVAAATVDVAIEVAIVTEDAIEDVKGETIEVVDVSGWVWP